MLPKPDLPTNSSLTSLRQPISSGYNACQLVYCVASGIPNIPMECWVGIHCVKCKIFWPAFYSLSVAWCIFLWQEVWNSLSLICSFGLLGGTDVCHVISDTVKHAVCNSQSSENSPKDFKIGKLDIWKQILYRQINYCFLCEKEKRLDNSNIKSLTILWSNIMSQSRKALWLCYWLRTIKCVHNFVSKLLQMT